MKRLPLLLVMCVLGGCASASRPRQTAAAAIKPAAQPVLYMSIEELGNFKYDQDNGGNIPDRVKKLSGSTIRLVGYMVPSDQYENITEFALVPAIYNIDGGGEQYTSQPPLIQHTIMVECPPGKEVDYYSDRIAVTGKLTVAEKKDDGYIVSIFEVQASSVTPAHWWSYDR